ncbi:hypothetical protein RF11_12880 [Thelohanellus kitauei]|uniref:Uncharacterized protein n=1 Tax=Thelohanellus kitauei TaxID=669202 RepID=A0A0C2M322_THEKT|nr:hypothetical protein RF11_12880 [Thelohanellus kitauei]
MSQIIEEKFYFWMNQDLAALRRRQANLYAVQEQLQLFPTPDPKNFICEAFNSNLIFYLIKNVLCNTERNSMFIDEFLAKLRTSTLFSYYEPDYQCNVKSPRPEDETALLHSIQR